MRKVSRRELARMLAALPTLGAVPLGGQVPAPSGYIGPLTGITKGLDGRRFDPVPFTRDLYAAAPRRLRFEARTRGQAEEWQQQLRARLIDLLGVFPLERQPLRERGEPHGIDGLSHSRPARSPATGARKSCSTAGPASACSRTSCFPQTRRLLRRR